jgi:hypothetical protein
MVMALPLKGADEKACCTAQQKAARALHRTAPDATADRAVPPLPNQLTRREMVASDSNNFGSHRRSLSAGGMALPEYGR